MHGERAFLSRFGSHVAPGAVGQHNVGQCHRLGFVGLCVSSHRDGEADDKAGVATQRAVLHGHHHDGVLVVRQLAQRDGVTVRAFINERHVAAALLVGQGDVELHSDNVVVVVKIYRNVCFLACHLREVSYAQVVLSSCSACCKDKQAEQASQDIMSHRLHFLTSFLPFLI